MTPKKVTGRYWPVANVKTNDLNGTKKSVFSLAGWQKWYQITLFVQKR
jgi:hypothetical protein